jgi:hypothetical protein
VGTVERSGPCWCKPQLAQRLVDNLLKIFEKNSEMMMLGAHGLPLLKPFSIGYVKGWRRCTALLAALAGIYELKMPLEELSTDFKAEPCVCWCCVSRVCPIFVCAVRMFQAAPDR